MFPVEHVPVFVFFFFVFRRLLNTEIIVHAFFHFSFLYAEIEKNPYKSESTSGRGR